MLRALGASIIEDSGRMLLVEAPEQPLRAALASDHDWLVAPEVSYVIPNPRHSVK